MSRPLTPELRALLWAFALLALGAGVLLFVLADETETWFSWTIAPPASAGFLGASYWAAMVLIGWSAMQHDWSRVRPAIVPVSLIAALLLVATLLHLDRFDLDSVFGWFWLSTYAIVPPALALLASRQLRAPRSVSARPIALPAGMRPLLAAQALVMGALGIALFVAPDAADDLWPWSLTALTARAIGAFLVGFAVAAIHAALEDERARFRGAALAYLTLGVLQLLSSGLHADDLRDADPQVLLYRGFLVTVVAVGLWGVAATRARASRAASGSS